MTTNIIIYTPASSRFTFFRSVSKFFSTGPRLPSPPPLGFALPPPSSSVVRSFSRSSDMDATAGLNLYPSHRTKTIHLVRHAQGFHNVAGDKDINEYLSYDYLDAQLTPLGWQQVDNLHKHVQSCELFKRIELVITSPLSRTIQTAVGTFGGEGYSDGINVPPLMVANAGDSNRPAISSLNCPPFLAVELCREHLGVHPCDKRRSISEYRSLFPAIDFSMIEHDDDILWKPDIRETNDEVADRGLKFLKWLWTRKEKEIAVVSHSGFLFHSLGAFGNDCHPSIKDEICKHFANCELRSFVLVDRSMTGSESSTTNFPGGLPQGLDLPSDVAAESHPEMGVTNEDVA
ncbi:phosphoglycerate mutase-like protein 1 [Momordica charantia]|uniref:Phosphoglycerate mutase-like protein 1 n=1 Tax=Momordica charantia TaxID=3673 RepID=A0A6J1CJV8_MOMCH|nr:phosphoglycerate mutase-like protein 1 [Momordica charantia]XP_022141656.1 phosphoglycerate mutase-like protein 1 [Momordica charantia]